MRERDAVAVGEEIPFWTMELVDPGRMKTMAAILRDPYTVHWDRAGNERVGIGPRVINQGPLNVGYIANLLIAWAGPECIRRLTLAFGRPVLDGDRVIARGVLTDIRTVDEELLAICDVWLDRAGEHVVTGTAVVRMPTWEPDATRATPAAPQRETPTT